MPDEHQKVSRLFLTTGRVEALADGIFGFAMTLLVVNLTVPRGTDSAELGSYIYGLLDNFYAYFLAFMLLGSHWVIHHHQFHYIKRSDARLIWINITLLLFVALMPFSTSLLADYSDTWIAQFFFSGNLMMLGLLLLAIWAYATGRHRLVDTDLDRDIIERGMKRRLVLPGTAATAIIVSVFYPQWGSYLYFIIPLIFFAPPFRRGRMR